MSKMLRRMGYEVLLADSGRQWTGGFQQGAEPHQCDYHRCGHAEMDGVTMLEKVRRITPPITAIIGSGGAAISLACRIQEFVGDHRGTTVLRKPFTMASVLVVIQHRLPSEIEGSSAAGIWAQSPSWTDLVGGIDHTKKVSFALLTVLENFAYAAPLFDASVAQLVEQLTLNQLVLGSSPSWGINFL